MMANIDGTSFQDWFENMSRITWAPSLEGTFRETHWFYERARGQYRDGSVYKTAAEKRRFELENPKNQRITKNHLAKFMNVWRGKPDLVNTGTRINLESFDEYIKAEWDQDRNRFNVAFYQECIAKAIIFKEVERLVPKQDWYGGLKGPVVTYAISKLAYEIDKSGMALDFRPVWSSQDVPLGFRNILLASAEAANSVIRDYIDTSNYPVTLVELNSAGSKIEPRRLIYDVYGRPEPTYMSKWTWVTVPECWMRVRGHRVAWPEPVEDYCMTKGKYDELYREGHDIS